MKKLIINPILMASILALGFLTGAGIFQHLFWIPEMFESPNALENNLSGKPDEPLKFWIPLHAIAFLTLIASLVLNWKLKNRKRWIIWAFIGYIYISLISIYFARKLFAFKEINNLSEFVEQTTQWLLLSWHRPILMSIIEIFLLIALSKSIEKKISLN